VKPEEILIVCDDVNLPLGALRIRAQGGSGGHHGLASCLEQLQTEQIARLRLGVGVAALPRDLTEFVLCAFHREERPVIERAIAQAADACESWVSKGV
jgi:PTH1 family peptidyl-tRNA hydrolase